MFKMEMTTAGIDVGTSTVKAVILNYGEIASWHIIIGQDEDAASLGEKALRDAAAKVNINPEDIQYVTATGLVDQQIPFVNERVPEAICLARGVDQLMPTTRTALDLGAGKSLAVKCQHGRLLKIARNDKCASGTGKYLDIVADVWGIGVKEISPIKEG